MKHSLLFVSLLLSAGIVEAKPAKKPVKGPSIVWRTDYDTALQEARRTHKPLFIDFYTDWCSWCKVLDRTTYRDPKFVRASRDWVMVKLNAGKGRRNAQVSRRYRVDSFPTMLMLSGRGKVLNQVSGAFSTRVVLSEMRKAQTASGILMVQSPTAPRPLA